MHGDYAAFVCGTCGGSQRFGMNGEEACPSCCGKGVVFEVQNSHFSSTIDSNEIPIHYTKQ
jgi:DnaJ-class molecular chaperone